MTLEKAARYLLAADLTVLRGVVVRDHIFVKPNEPYVQLPYIQQHIDATLEAYHLDQVKVVDWNLPSKPFSPDQMLASKTLQNAPVLPSWVSYLEEPPDVQHLSA